VGGEKERDIERGGDISKRIPLTPSYFARDGSGCLAKESLRLRNNVKSERKSFARSIAAHCKNGDLETL